jgi:hypothetical protein
MDISQHLSEEGLVSIAENYFTAQLDIARSGISYAEKPPSARDIFEQSSIEEIGRLAGTFESDERLGHHAALPYWTRLKQEFVIFLCTEDKKYADLRRKIDSAGTKSQTTIVSMIAAAVAINVGLAAGALVPFCALLMLGMVRIGKNAFCGGASLNVQIIESKKDKKTQLKRGK